MAFHGASVALAQDAPAAPPPTDAKEHSDTATDEGLALKRECIGEHAGVQRARAAQHLAEARTRAVSCSRPECPEVIRAECAGWLSDIAHEQPTVILAARDGSGRALKVVSVREGQKLLVGRLDGQSIELDPGMHTLRFEGAGVKREVQAFVRANEKQQLVEITLSRPDPLGRPSAPSRARSADVGEESRGLPTASWIFGGIAAGGLVSAGYFGLSGLSQQRDLERTCAPRCATDDVDRMHESYVAADISLGVALVATAGAIWFALSQSAEKPHSSALGGRHSAATWPE